MERDRDGAPADPKGLQQGLFGTPEPPQARRIRLGHVAMWERWILIKGVSAGTGRDKYLKTWDEGHDRLADLCAELTEMGWTKCLYEMEEPQYACLVCPAKPFKKEECPAWKIEL